MRTCTLWLGVVTVAATLVGARGAEWWESTVVYQIYPRSFKDSDGDGIGDLKGIISKLEYIKELGVDAIWLSPIYKSPMKDFGYDISDYKDIASEYGTLEDFDTLMTEAKRLEIRVILDYVPNHTSDESEWFILSKNRTYPYTNYYIWADGITDAENNTSPPSNWISVFRKSAWEYSSERDQYYLHQFVTGQPDLNYRSEKVRTEMENVLRFWLNRGVSGFRIDAVNYLYEVDPADYGGVYPDEPLSGAAGAYPGDYEYLDHIYTRDLNETYRVVYDWRAVLDEYTSSHNESKLMMTEGYTDLEHMMLYYGQGTRTGSIPFNFIFLGQLSGTSTANDMKSTIDEWMNNMPAGKTANWVNGNHDQSRLATRHGENRVDAMNMLALLLPGITITYQGEEIGMTDGVVSWEETEDPQACNTDDPILYWKKSRDPERTPFQWNSTTNAGFSTAAKTWLPVASNYATVNVEVQQAANKSHIKFYQDVVSLKHTTIVSAGELNTTALSETIFVITRSHDDGMVLGIINLANSTQEVNLTALTDVATTLEVVASGVSCSLEKEVKVQKTAISMAAHCALALRNSTTTPTPSDGAHQIATSSLLVFSIAFILCRYIH